MSEKSVTLRTERMPHDLEAEKELIRSILVNNQVLDDVRRLISPNDFYDYRHQLIMRAILNLADRQASTGIDLITLTHELEREGQQKELGGWQYLHELADLALHSVHATHYARIVSEKSIQRMLLQAAQSIHREASYPSDPEQLLEHSEQLILRIRDASNASEIKPLQVGLHKLLDRADEQCSGKIERWYTGFQELDSLVKLSAGKLIIIAARPSVGKSLLATQLAKQISDHASGRRAVYLSSLEMEDEEIAARFVASFGNVPMDVASVERVLNRPESEQLSDAVHLLADIPIFINDSGTQSLTTIAADARRLNRKHGLGLVVVDYLQLVTCETNRNKNRAEAMGEISSGLKRLAKELQCPVIALCQLNREADDVSEPQLRHIRESGNIEQDADTVWLLWREAKEVIDPNADQEVFLKIAKNRQGPIGTIKLLHRKEYMRFEELLSYDQPSVMNAE
ncbi:MAG: replicative DNA helicase [Planctomycetia bacterium]|nr:replicative DNA helicase [Planctomycetia bacterium]